MTDSTTSISTCRLKFSRPLRMGEATAVRGFFGRKFEDEVYMHNHKPDGSPIYLYPRIQYKVLNSTALIVGVNEGSSLLQRLWLEIDETKLGNQNLPVLESEFQSTECSISVVDAAVEYQFVSPWLALNQKNHSLFVKEKSVEGKRAILEKTLVGNCLSFCKSLGIPRFTSDQIIKGDCTNLKLIETSLKGKGMIGFIGKFFLNMNLPNFIGLGKSVSRGFGAIERTSRYGESL